jgi:hypothetical protein
MLGLAATGQAQNLRPPAVPLLTSDPYLSVWSEADHATDDVTRHWTKRPNPLVSLIKIDGVNYRLLGNSPSDVPPLPQVGLTVTFTKTDYMFKNSQVQVDMSFLSPAIPTDLEVYSRPLTYVHWEAKSLDGAKHLIQLYDSTSSLLAVNDPAQKVDWKRQKFGNLTALRAGTVDQTFLRPAGDDTRIDWGYIYAAALSSRSTSSIGSDKDLKNEFLSHGSLENSVDSNMPRSASAEEPVLGFAFDLGEVGNEPKSCTAMIAYDEIYSIDYYGKRLRPYWRRNGAGPSHLFLSAEREYPRLAKDCASFDTDLAADAVKAGGDKYAQIIALAYRECVAANGLAADDEGKPLLFTKENTSNGDIATVDVIFPMDPIWVLLSPTLAKASLVSNFEYAASSHWKFPNAPHDLGTYPQVFGRDDGGEGMPVEESGNMILLTDAIAHDENSAEFASQYWPQLTQWAAYLEKYGLDPEDQLCTDDFMGHLAHNANLSVKAILALAAYGDLCKMKGENAAATKYSNLAKVDAEHWIKVADAGDHSLLAFDKPGTWSQKYNLVWDQILGLKVFPDSVRNKEVAFYKTKLLEYGLPLDSRTRLTKTDWSIWSATLSQDQTDFESIIDPIYDYINATTARDPIADSYETDNIHSGGMHARPVVGGFFIQMLNNPAIWKKWSGYDLTKISHWAPLPKPPVTKVIVPSGQSSKDVVWRYTTSAPSESWTNPDYNDSTWMTGKAGFGSTGTPSIAIGTQWTSDDIWLRRTLTLPSTSYAGAVLHLFHDEDVDVYINGVLAAREPGFISDYENLSISAAARKFLKPGATVTLAVHCHQTEGGQGIDVGIASEK